MTNKAGEQPTITQSLEPCPFCEGDAAIQDRSGCRGYTTSSRYQPPIYVPVCVDCDASIDQFGTKAEAIAAWNTRTTSLAAQDGLVEALERCAQIVEQWNHRQNEKVDDIKYIVRNALSAIKGDKS